MVDLSEFKDLQPTPSQEAWLRTRLMQLGLKAGADGVDGLERIGDREVEPWRPKGELLAVSGTAVTVAAGGSDLMTLVEDVQVQNGFATVTAAGVVPTLPLDALYVAEVDVRWTDGYRGGATVRVMRSGLPISESWPSPHGSEPWGRWVDQVTFEGAEADTFSVRVNPEDVSSHTADVTVRLAVVERLASVSPSEPSPSTFDVSDGSLALTEIDDTYLWVADGNNGGGDRWLVVDWSDPSNMSTVATVPRTDSMTFLTAADVWDDGTQKWGLGLGTRTSLSTNIMVVDLSDPTSPTVADSSVSTNRSQWGRFMDGTYLCCDGAGAGAGVRVYDWSAVQSGGAVSQVGNVSLSGVGFNPTGGACVSPDTNKVVVIVSNEDSLAFVDTSTKSSPSQESVDDWSGTYSVSTAGEFLDNTYVAICAAEGLVIFDTTNMAAVTVDNVVALSGSAAAIKVLGSTAYVGFSGGGMAVVDVADPTSPTLLSEVTTGPGGSGRESGGVSGKVAFPSGADIAVWQQVP